MRELTTSEVLSIDGGKRRFFNVFAGALWGATFGAILGIPAGPAGIISGIFAGAYNGAAIAVAKEGAEGLVELQNGTGY